ncbi:MAG: hypothetical protein AB1711_12265 [Thermodesulfobacteriota bacterium]
MGHSQRQDSIIKNIKATIESINAYFADFSKVIDNKIINEKEHLELIDELETSIKHRLEIIFGKEKRLHDFGYFKDIIDFNSIKNAIIFNYWSLKGEFVDSSISKDNRYRDNVFYKGMRWSNSDSYNAFYLLFNELKKTLEGVVPVDFFTQFAINNTNYLKIVGRKSTDLDCKYQYLEIPILNDIDFGISTDFKKLITSIYNMRNNNRNYANAEKFKAENELAFKNLHEKVREAFFSNNTEQLLSNWRESFVNALADGDKKKKILRKKITLIDVLKVIVTYQFYDHPYVIHMFLPSFPNSDKDENNIDKNHYYSCLVVTQGQKDVKKLEPFKDTFIELSNSLKKIAVLEKKLWDKKGENLPIYWRWKSEYEKYYEQYDRLSNVALNICTALCKKLKIEYLKIPNRIKTFESFYNKIVSRANGRDKEFPRLEDLRDTEFRRYANRTDIKRLTKKVKNSFIKYYKAKISNVTETNADYIFKALKDMVGLRILCVYKNDMGKILQTVKQFKEENNGPIKVLDIKEYDRKAGYRSCHIVFQLSDAHKEIYELNDLADKTCEIQIRTILEQGWADVSHRLKYKHKPHLPERLRNTIDDETKSLNDRANELNKVDRHFVKMRDRVKQILKDDRWQFSDD